MSTCLLIAKNGLHQATLDEINEELSRIGFVAAPRLSYPEFAGSTVLASVSMERQRQDEKWGGAEHDDHHTTAEFVQLIEDYAGWARVMAGMNSPEKARNRLIQVAALAVAAVESLDRKQAGSKS